MIWYLAFHAIVVIGIFRDARRRGYDAWWALMMLAVVPSPVGLFAYLWARPPLLPEHTDHP